MNKTQIVSHKGKNIVYVDLSGCKEVELSSQLAEAKMMISHQGKETVLLLTNVTGVELTKESSRLMKDFSSHNTPYVKASAVIGVEGLQKIIYSAVQRVSGRKIPTFETVEQAKDWLVSQ